ncbi:MAG: hypothetical protein JO040_15385 [Gemmatimonadetes bacterium]|nr:hypothetical protein [Gemmatimonadota bacterium]
MKVQPARNDVSRPRRPGRRSPPPPAILHGPDETLDGACILDELRDPVGVLLWQSLHDVILWASVPPPQRQGLFRPESVRRRLAVLVGARTDPALEAALTSLAALVGDPASARPEAVGPVCLQIARWAETKGKPATALAFAQGAALVVPTDAAAGLAAGHLARQLGETARAETWLRRTVVLGRRSGDRLSLCQACVVLGDLCAERGDLEAARPLYLRAFRGARRSGFREIKAQALYSLFRAALSDGRPEEAEAYARGALYAHGRRHPRFAQVAREVAGFWLERGRFTDALDTLRLLVPHARRPTERIAVLAGVARAAAGAANVEEYDEAAQELWRTLRRTAPGPEGARALLELARASVALKRWQSAERAAQTALELALRHREGESAAEAEVLLTGIWKELGGMRCGPEAGPAEG